MGVAGQTDPRARGDTEGPKAGSQHPADKRPRRSRLRRRQRAAAAPDFPPGTGVTKGGTEADKDEVGGSSPARRLGLVLPTSTPSWHALLQLQGSAGRGFIPHG